MGRKHTKKTREVRNRREERPENNEEDIQQNDGSENTAFVERARTTCQSMSDSPRADAVAPNNQRRWDRDERASDEVEECELGTRPIDPGHGLETHDTEMTVDSTERVNGGGNSSLLPRRPRVLRDSDVVRQRAPSMASHSVGMAGVDSGGNDSDGPQHRRVRQNTCR